MGCLVNNLILFLFIKASCTTLFPAHGAHRSKNVAKRAKHTSEAIEEIQVRNDYFRAAAELKKLNRIKNKAMALRTGGPLRSTLHRTKGVEEQQRFRKDPVMNMMLRGRRKLSDTDYASSSSSIELQHWKDEWKDVWLVKKLEALNSSVPVGDTVNMAAARPWGVPCGDPNQHDMPWGSCVLAQECEPELRVYRGDLACGRSAFVCCALQLSTYDMYGGFDVSFAESSLETDTEERRLRDMSSREKRQRKRRREKRKRKRDRLKRKRKIKKNIKNIIKELRKILDRSYRNGTSMRKKKTKQLKRFIKELKKQYRKDRQSVKEIHEMEVIKIDAELMKKLTQIRLMNRNFMKNGTFRDIVVNGTMNKKQARMLMEAYPELEGSVLARRAAVAPDYDLEYGYLYY
ncbi:uncharacterized protein [Battus philenor]|uniref:uncharacterized protein n=1 Tax=Battus philenor TaxID=42288 RepID=UPI0035D0FA32